MPAVAFLGHLVRENLELVPDGVRPASNAMWKTVATIETEVPKRNVARELIDRLLATVRNQAHDDSTAGSAMPQPVL
jgi:hypothetical protein